MTLSVPSSATAGSNVAIGNPLATNGWVARSIDTTTVASFSRTNTGSSADVDLTNYSAVLLVVDISSVTGVSPTLVVSWQIKDPTSGNYATHQSTTSQNATGTVRLQLTTPLGQTGRVLWTIGGTSPSFAFTVSITKEA